MKQRFRTERFDLAAWAIDQVPPLSRRDFLAWSAGAVLAATYLSGRGSAHAQGSLNTKYKLPEITSVPATMKGSGQIVVASWGASAPTASALPSTNPSPS